MNKFCRVAFAALLLGLLFAGTSAAATGRAECNSIPSKILARSVRYCVLLPPSFDAEKTRHYPILYFLHGLGDNEQMFIHSGGMNLVQDLQEQNQIGEFLIVTPAGNASFYINSHDGQQRHEDFFLQEFMPEMEKRYRAEPGRAHRGIAGISMGGYGALHLAFRHPQLFGAVEAHSAALLEKLPNITTQDSRQIGRLRILGGAFGSPFDPAFWNQNDPLTIARTANLSGLKIYFDCGSEDEYGFDTGAVVLDKLLTSRHIAHEFHLYPGGHSWTYFAEHLPESLEFQSHAFNLSPTASAVLERFAVEDGTFGDLETQGFVNFLRKSVGELRIGSDFGAALGAGPVFSGVEKPSSDSLSAMRGGDVPAFDVADGARRVAAIGAGAQSYFNKPNKHFFRSFGDKDDARQDAQRFAREDGLEFLRMFGCGGLRPERLAQSSELLEIGWFGTPHHRQTF